MNLQYIFSKDNIISKFRIPLEINKSYSIELPQRRDINKILVVYKGVYICHNAYEYYFIFKLLDFYGLYGNEEIINTPLRLRVITDENIDFIENNIQNNIANGRLIRNEKKICSNHKEKSLKEWIYEEPYICISVKVGGQGSTLYINEQQVIFIGETKEYKILEDNYTYPLPKHILSYKESTEHEVVHAQCNQVNVSGNYYFIEFEGDTYNNLVSQIPIIINPRELENGVYTYVILSIGASEPNLYLFTINTIFELGTKHPELVEKIAKNNNADINTFHIYYAGEIKVIDNQILFNFNSGGFMLNLVSVKDLIEGKPLMIGKLRMIFDPKYEITYANETLINRRHIQFTQEELDNFKQMGAIIKEFDNEDECYEYRNDYYINKYRYSIGGRKVLIIKTNKYKKQNSKKRHSKKGYSKKRYSKKRYSKKRHSTKKRRNNKYIT
jgi:hypothetical protein